MTTRAQPPLPTQAHRRQRAASYSSSSSSSSSFSTASSAASSPSPSPRTTSIPFSWEHHPGIPKNHSFLRGAADPAASPSAPLPLPPPIRASPSRRRANRSAPGAPGAADPFAAALAECTRERTSAIDIDALFPPKPASAVRAGPRRWSIATGGVVGLLDLYGCRNAMGVAEGAFVVRRPVGAVGRAGQGRAGRPGKR
ncbi:hypothetical protein D1007_19527 [Hordeum vulgare]|uniref:Predicted protein n=1 Tax=Hordeum vulgare subsp. vulgare TaxID=112509 RepID=F2EB79_HORVV|nr:translation initiation factor IF-2-like [Hordeum vulgare subsp. vulgare]KAE8804490.1 hypothetical protein D1007_19527 [Hordeum vulgare]KAI4997495.1 hypothetical protein ZWY2020_052837 [Hordeum vulgare]BAK04601.1 predicted protein [Hordeum vulgare subsp. vulgare]